MIRKLAARWKRSLKVRALSWALSETEPELGEQRRAGGYRWVLVSINLQQGMSPHECRLQLEYVAPVYFARVPKPRRRWRRAADSNREVQWEGVS